MSTPTYIHKHDHLANTVTIPNATAQDHSLSWGARGLLTYLLSMPTDWQLNEAHLISCAPSGRDALRQLVRELEAHGYVRRTQLRGASGRVIHSQWEVWSTPQADTSTAPPHISVGSAGSPWTASPSTENPSTGETLSMAEELPSTEIPSTVGLIPSTASPATASPSTENPSEYKGNKETNKNPPASVSSSLRSEETLAAPPASPGGLVRTGENSQGLSAQQPTADQHGTSHNQLPPFLEPHRELLVAWWRVRKAKNPLASNEPPGPRTYLALEKADAQGMLVPYLQAAAQRGWLRLEENLYPRLSRLGAAGAYSPDFEAWFRAYSANSRRVSSLSKPKAWAEYRALTTGPKAIAPERLLDALGRAIRDQAAMEGLGGFAATFPDAHRWLRDGRHEQYLDDSTPQAAATPSHPAYVVAPEPDGDPLAWLQKARARAAQQVAAP